VGSPFKPFAFARPRRLRWIVRYLLFALALFFVLPAHAGKSPPKLLLRIHVQTTGSGMAADQARTVLLPPSGEPIQVRFLPEVTEQNLINVEQRPTGTLLFFDHEGQVNLSAVTAENQGRILVVFLNGYIIYAPVIDEQITDGQLLLPHALPPEIVKILQQMAADNLREQTRE
jgi:hypothetical protein